MVRGKLTEMILETEIESISKADIESKLRPQKKNLQGGVDFSIWKRGVRSKTSLKINFPLCLNKVLSLEGALISASEPLKSRFKRSFTAYVYVLLNRSFILGNVVIRR